MVNATIDATEIAETPYADHHEQTVEDVNGFKTGSSGAHLSRTLMVEELRLLLETVPNDEFTHDAVVNAILELNCLKKRSLKTRQLTLRHLIDLYSLNSATPLFAGFLYYVKRDPDSLPLIALLAAYGRDSLLRLSARTILKTEYGATVSRKLIEDMLEREFPERYSPATIKSTAQNLNSSWTKTGHLSGRQIKFRTQAKPTPAAVAYALYLSHLSGARGPNLFETEYVKILDSTAPRVIELAENAAQKGWMILQRIGHVVEVRFPHIRILEDRK